MALRNSQGITRITMKPTAITKCQIGQDWYKHEFYIEFTPGDFYPDYMEEEKWIMANIDGMELNIEDAVSILYSHINKAYNPKELHITDYISGNKVHFDVIVEK